MSQQSCQVQKWRCKRSTVHLDVNKLIDPWEISQHSVTHMPNALSTLQCEAT